MPGNFIRGQTMFEQRNNSTTSLIECTDEDFHFVPKLETGVRRTSSLDDITRFYRYFHLVQGNLGKLFTWQQYLKILQHQLSNLETLTILGKAMLPFMQVHQTEKSKSVPASETSNYVVQESDCVTAAQAPLVEIEMVPPKLNSALADCVAPTQIEKLSPMSTPQFEFADLCQSSEKSEGTSANYSTLSLMNRTRVMMKICSETKTLAQKINKTADIISHLPHKCTECGASLEGRGHKQNCIESIETGGDATGNLEEIKLEDPIERELSSFSPTNIFQLSSFSEKSSVGAGESTVLLTKTKDNPRRKGSIKLLAKLCKQWVTRK